MSATLSTPKTTSGGEIIRELVNASDGQGLHFDGAAGNIDIASPPDLGTKFSFEFVVQADKAQPVDEFIFDFYNNSPAARFGLYRDSADTLLIATTGGEKVFTGSDFLSDLKVHHLIVTVDGTAAIIYDNGNQVGTATLGAAATIDDADTLKIGSKYNGTQFFFNGTYYRARLWNKTLTAAEVTASYENATVPFADQYGSQTELVSGSFANSTTADRQFGSISGASATGFTGVYDDGVGSNRVGATLTAALTAGKNYRATFDYTGSDGGMELYTSTGATIGGFQALGTLTAASATGHKVDFTVNASGGDYISFIDSSPPASGSFVVSNLSLVEIGCVADYDLAFANPTQSTMVQDRAGAADGTSSATGVTQVTPIEQLNSKSARIGTSAATPADGELAATTISAKTGSDGVVIRGWTGGTGYYAMYPASVTPANGNYALLVNGTQSYINATSTVLARISNANVGIFSSTGLAVTGAVTATTQALIGTTTSRTGDNSVSIEAAASMVYFRGAGTGSLSQLVFKRNTAVTPVTVGYISTDGSSTTYSTSSDYRLKENTVELTGALDRLDLIPAYSFNFKSDPTKTVDGFLAHEVAAHVPEAITGTKDEMETVVVTEAVAAVEAVAATYYEEGDELPDGVAVGDEKTPAVAAVEAVAEVTEEQPKYQGIDQSKLVPLMLAAIKELKAKVTALENA
jgi:hypothetical protein